MINAGPRESIPPNIPPLNTKARPSENAAREMVKSFISIDEKCQNDPVWSFGAGLKDCVNPLLKGLN